MDADVTLIRDLLARVIDLPGASPAVRRRASSMWHDLGDPDRAAPGDMARAMAALTGELRACRYAEHRDIREAADALRAALADGGDLPWEPTGHDVFARRTREMARAAGLDL